MTSCDVLSFMFFTNSLSQLTSGQVHCWFCLLNRQNPPIASYVRP
jgi:hypothetical protein